MAGSRCIYCDKTTTTWDLFLGFFWKFPLRWSEVSQIWEHCCSYKCYELELERQLNELIEEGRIDGI